MFGIVRVEPFNQLSPRGQTQGDEHQVQHQHGAQPSHVYLDSIERRSKRDGQHERTSQASSNSSECLAIHGWLSFQKRLQRQCSLRLLKETHTHPAGTRNDTTYFITAATPPRIQTETKRIMACGEKIDACSRGKSATISRTCSSR